MSTIIWLRKKVTEEKLARKVLKTSGEKVMKVCVCVRVCVGAAQVEKNIQIGHSK